VPVLAAYPAQTADRVHGTFGSAADRDLFSLAAREHDGGFCFNDKQDKPLRAHLVLSAPAQGDAAVCACWSTVAGPCSRSRNSCVTAHAGASATLDLPMRMVCGQDDEGTLDLEVRSASTASGCEEWTLEWTISE
jgi:hypothetical protein